MKRGKVEKLFGKFLNNPDEKSVLSLIIFVLIFVLMSLVLILLTIKQVSAYYGSYSSSRYFGSGGSVTEIIDSAIEFLRPILILVFGDNGLSGEYIFIKFLIFILFLFVISASLKRISIFNNNRAGSILISMVVSILAIRFLVTESLINFIWFQYGLLGILISSLLPFLIFFFFIESFDISFVRKIGWISYSIIYFILAIYKWDSFAIKSTKWYSNFGVIYLIIGITALAMYIWDKSLHTMIAQREIDKVQDAQKKMKIIDLNDEIKNLLDKLPKAQNSRDRQIILDQIKTRKLQIKSILRS